MTSTDSTGPDGGLAGIGVVIPALNPPDGSLEFLGALGAAGFGRIWLVDDGSRAEFEDHFARAGRIARVSVLRHPVNRGKGAGLRTGIAAALADTQLIGVVTTDADGQHAVADVVGVARALLVNHGAGRDAIILGVRDFTRPGIPPRSRLGNRITSRLLAVLFGRYVSDTQTGLRGFPRGLAERVIEIGGDRFEYEMNVLLWALTERVMLQEVPITTIYHDATNSVSNFRPLRDATRIYATILRQFLGFVSTSLLGALVDLAGYATLMVLVFRQQTPGQVAVAVVAARVISSLVNFWLNRRLVFGARAPAGGTMARYYLLAFVLLVASAGGTSLLSWASGGHVLWAKVITDFVLFMVSYLVQKRWVFAPRTDRADARRVAGRDPAR